MQTGNASAAYRAGYNTKNMKRESVAVAVNACQLKKNTNVALMLEQLRNRQMQKYDVTVAALTAELDEIQRRSVENGKYGAGVRAIMFIARLHGLDKPKTQVSTKREYSAEERTLMLQDIFSRNAVPNTTPLG